MQLVNPFEEVVVFGKAYDLMSGSAPVAVRALVPTGGHVGTANDLKVVRRNGGGGPATKLEIYRRRKSSVGKAAPRKGVANGLKLIASQPKPATVAPQKFSAPTPRLGVKKQRAQLSMESARARMRFGDEGSVGKRLAD